MRCGDGPAKRRGVGRVVLRAHGRRVSARPSSLLVESLTMKRWSFNAHSEGVVWLFSYVGMVRGYGNERKGS